MVAFTPLRGYPYSTPTDPADVPAAIQALAEAVDLDVEALDLSVGSRPFASVYSSTPVGDSQVFPPNTETEATFTFVQADTAGISDLSTQPTRLTPTSAGLWLVYGSIGVPQGASTPGTSIRNVFLRVNGVDVGRNGYVIQDPDSGVNQMTTACMAFMDGVDDYFTMTFNPVNALDDLKIRLKQMACFRVTNT